jgi:hypothetical protein
MSSGTEAPPTLEESVATMSTEERYSKFLGMLHARKMSIDRLAKLATRQPKSRTHVLEVLKGKRAGTRTWLFLVDYLTRDELIVLGKKHLIVVAPTE